MIDYSSSIPSRTLEPAHEDVAALPLWTLTLAVLALLTLGLTAVPAIICGHRALADTRHSNNESPGRSVALMGLVIAYVGAAFLGAWITFVTGLLFAH